MDGKLLAGGIVVVAVGLTLFSIPYINYLECVKNPLVLCEADQGPFWMWLLLTPVGVALISFSIRKSPRLDSEKKQERVT